MHPFRMSKVTTFEWLIAGHANGMVDEEPHHRLCRGRISRVSRAHRERCAQSVSIDPLFCASSGASAALRAAGAGAAPSCWRSFETGKHGHQVDGHRRSLRRRQQMTLLLACASGGSAVVAVGGSCRAFCLRRGMCRPVCVCSATVVRLSLLDRCFVQPSRTESRPEHG